MFFFDFTWVVAVISIVGTVFNIKKNVLCFYLWIITELICFYIDIKNLQYGRAVLDIFGFGMNVYGIITWSNDLKKSNDD